MPSEFSPKRIKDNDSRAESTEKSNEKPSEGQVIDAFLERRATLRKKVDEIENRSGGFRLDATGVMNKHHELRDAQSELDEFESSWKVLGGDKLDEAEANRKNLNFQSTAEDHIQANAQLRDAKAAFYQTFLDEQAKQDEIKPPTPENKNIPDETLSASVKALDTVYLPFNEPEQSTTVGKNPLETHPSPADVTGTSENHRGENPVDNAGVLPETSSQEESSDERVDEIFGGEHDNDDPFDIGNEVTVRRSDGTVEYDWVVEDTDDNSVKVTKKDEHGEKIVKWIPRDELAALNVEATENPVDNAGVLPETDEAQEIAGVEEVRNSSDRDDAAKEGATEAAVRERAEQFDGVKDTVMERYRDEYNAKIDELAEIQGKLTTKRLGRRKNQDNARTLELEIAHLNKHIARDFVKMAEENGLYDIEGADPEAVKRKIIQRKQDDALKLAMESSQELWVKTSEKLENRQENLNVFQKFMQKTGTWINKGNKRNWLAGFGAGFLTGGVPAAIGVTFPVGSMIVSGVGVSAGAFNYFSAREANIAQSVKNRSELIDYENDPLVKKIKEEIDARTTEALEKGELNGKKEGEKVAEHATDILFGAQRNENVKTNEHITQEAKMKMKRFMGGFGIGAATGALTGHFVHNQLFSGGDAQVAPNKSSTPNGSEGPSNGVGSGTGGAEKSVQHLVQINTNGAPEHALSNLQQQWGVGNHMSLSELNNATGGHVFETANGNPVPIKNFGGNVGLGWGQWDVTQSVQLTSAARAALGVA